MTKQLIINEENLNFIFNLMKKTLYKTELVTAHGMKDGYILLHSEMVDCKSVFKPLLQIIYHPTDHYIFREYKINEIFE